MQYIAYLRDEATRYRHLAEEEDRVLEELELLELASVCETVANEIEERMPSG